MGKLLDILVWAVLITVFVALVYFLIVFLAIFITIMAAAVYVLFVSSFDILANLGENLP